MSCANYPVAIVHVDIIVNLQKILFTEGDQPIALFHIVRYSQLTSNLPLCMSRVTSLSQKNRNNYRITLDTERSNIIEPQSNPMELNSWIPSYCSVNKFA